MVGDRRCAVGAGVVRRRLERDARELRENSAYRRDPPNQIQCEMLWSIDKDLRVAYANGEGFYHFCVERHREGNLDYSKAGINTLITARQIKRRPLWVQRKIAGHYAKKRGGR